MSLTHLVTPPIAQSTYLITSWACCAVATATVALRVAIRLRIHKTLHGDDYLLLFSSACLLAATAFNTTQLPQLYKVARYILNGTSSDAPKSLDELQRYIRTEAIAMWVFSVLTWTVIYAAKFAYLIFFRALVLRVQILLRYWWIVVAITAISSVLAIASPGISCPWSDLRAVQCFQQPQFGMLVRLNVGVQILDIVTDVMIVCIPMAIIAKVKIKNMQKFVLLLFLCLSSVLVSIAIVRVSHFRIRTAHGSVTFSYTWLSFWAHVEACLAVCSVSVTAFRSFFIFQEQRRQEREAKHKWFSSAIGRIRQKSLQMAPRITLLSIPSGTMTGLRSFFGGSKFVNSHHNTDASLGMSGRLPLGLHNASQVTVTKTFQTHVREVTDDPDPILSRFSFEFPTGVRPDFYKSVASDSIFETQPSSNLDQPQEPHQNRAPPETV